MSKDPTSCLYFVENLTVISWVLCIIPYFVCRRSVRPVRKHRIYFIDGSRLGKLLVRLTSWIVGGEAEQLAFRLVDIRDDSGALIRLRIPYHDLAEVHERITASALFKNVLRDLSANDRMSTFLMKQFGVAGSLDSNSRTLWRALLLIHIAVWKARQDGDGEVRGVFFMGMRMWLQEIDRYASQYHVKIVWVHREKVLGCRAFLSGLKAILPRSIKSEGRALISLYSHSYGLLKHLIHQFPLIKGVPIAVSGLKQHLCDVLQERRVRRNGLLQRSSPRLVAQYYGHLNLNRPELHSDLFFWQQSQLQGKDILLEFSVPSDPLNEEKWSEIREHGISEVVLHPQAATLPSVPVFFPVTRLRKAESSSRRLKNLLCSREGTFLLQQFSNYHHSYSYWADFFERYSAKLYVSWFKYDASHCVIADALRDQGGITAIYQRAFEEFPSPETTIAADIVFGFAQEGAEIERLSHSVIPYYVVTGYLGDHRFSLSQNIADEVRCRLMKNGAKFVLSFFDENSGDDSRWCTGHEFMRENYLFLLEKVLSESQLGLVLKPKVPSTLRRRLGGVADLLKSAEETGRCFLFETGGLYGSYAPVAAALSSDVAVHGHLCAATAGVEAALAGVPTLLMDREGWPVSKLYRLGEGRVVFTNWKDLWTACKDHWVCPKGMSGFGDWSLLLDEIDPFRDGRAAERMGTYLKWLLDGFKSGGARDMVMADAAERYCREWGQDKVIEVIDCQE